MNLIIPKITTQNQRKIKINKDQKARMHILFSRNNGYSPSPHVQRLDMLPAEPFLDFPSKGNIGLHLLA
mgnify:FL=1